MGICTCKNCICLFKAAVVLNAGMIGILLSVHILFGSMPPSFTIVSGFWVLLYANYVGIFVALTTTSTLARKVDIHWINQLSRIGFVTTSVLFLLGAVLFFVPLSAGSMFSYTKWYFRAYKMIPPFLDTAQEKFQCCGVYNYTDYGHSLTNQSFNNTFFNVTREVTPEDDSFGQFKNSPNREATRITKGFNVPQSCCPADKSSKKKANFRDCGKEVEYTNATPGTDHWVFQNMSAREKINNPGQGCYDKYQKIMDTGYEFQLAFFVGMIQYTSLIQSVLFMLLLWFHHRALKALRQLAYWLPELTQLHDQSQSEVAKAKSHLSIAAKEPPKKEDKEKSGKEAKEGDDAKEDEDEPPLTTKRSIINIGGKAKKRHGSIGMERTKSFHSKTSIHKG